MNSALRRFASRATPAVMITVLLVCGSTLATGLLAVFDAGPVSAITVPPWEPDPNSVGGLLFFNSSGQAVTGGSVNDSPIAAYVEGTSLVRSGDTVATLYGYLPVDGEQPSAWSGEQLGGSTTFPNAAAPSPLNTSTLPLETGADGDETLATLESDFPNKDTSSDGYAGMYQLRLYTNAAHKSQTTTYDSADILISGSSWSVVYPATTTTTTALGASPTSPQPFGTPETLTATINPAAATGTVQFEDGTTDIGSPVTVSAGSAQTLTSTLSVGTHSLSAVFTPTSGSGYTASTGTTSFAVSSLATTTGLGASPISPQPFGTPETLTATINPSAATGTVQFEDGTTDIGSPVTVSAGSAKIETSTLPAGTDSLSAVFTPTSGSGYSASTGTTSFTVSAAPTTTGLGASPTSPQTFGTHETLTATVSPSAATGTVQFEDGSTDIGSSVTVSAGSAQIETSTLPVGTEGLSAVFTPNLGNGYDPSTGTLSFTVNPIPTTTSLGASPTSPQFSGAVETLTATVGPSAATGTVQFEVGSTDIGSPVTVSAGSAHIVTSTLPVGTDGLSAVFTPTAGNGYATSTGTTSFTVEPLTPTTTGLGASPASPQLSGTSETLTATVNPSAATGTVQFKVGSTDIGSPVTVSAGGAHIVTATLPVGTDSLSAVFTAAAGNGYAGSTGSASFTVEPLTPTTTGLGASPPSPQLWGAVETLTATVGPSAATGTVQFEVGSTDIGSPVTVSAGSAHIETSSLPVGTDGLSAVFTPTAGNGYASSTGTTSFTVDPLDSTSTALTSSANPSQLGASVTFTATVAGAQGTGGTVSFADDGATIGACAAVAAGSGVATCATTFADPGTYTVSATFSGNAQSAGSSSALTQLVGRSGKGYWLVASDGGVFNYGDAGFFGSAGAVPLNKPIVGIAATPDGGGYWLVSSDGGVFNYGDAGFFGSAGAVPLNKPIVGIAATPDGGGYWLVASDGGIFNYGDAGFFGSAGALPLNKPIVGIAATPDGGGYWLVASDGGIFSYGDAGFFGSAGAVPLNKPIVGIAATPDGGGYWLVASDGGIFNYGDAGFFGSAGAVPLNKPVVGIAATPDGGGYWLVASDGGIFNYGDAGFFGSAGAVPLNEPIVGSGSA